jgi:hypothetical protein
MKKIILFIAIAICYISCVKNSADNTTNNCNPNVSYSLEVKPIIAKSCNMAGCHDGVTITSLADYTTMHDGATQIKTSIVAGRMPKTGSLTATEKATIVCWVDNGAKNN